MDSTAIAQARLAALIRHRGSETHPDVVRARQEFEQARAESRTIRKTVDHITGSDRRRLLDVVTTTGEAAAS